MKEMIFAAVAFLLVFGMLFFAGIYSDTLRMECKKQWKNHTPLLKFK